MYNPETIHPSEIFGGKFTSTIERLQPSYDDKIVHKRSIDIMNSLGDERASREAQLIVYLAAKYALFPEESQIIIQSLTKDEDG